MITIAQIKQEIKTLTKEWESYTRLTNKPIPKKIKKRLSVLRHCILYLETNPSENFLKQTRDQLKNRIKTINNGFGAWLNADNDRPTLKKPKATYYAEMGMKQFRVQLETTEFLLNVESELIVEYQNK